MAIFSYKFLCDFVAILCSLIFVCEPDELKNFGLCAESLFSKWLGDPRRSYVSYQLRRINATVVFHASLPLFYGFYLDEHLRSGSEYLKTKVGVVSILPHAEFGPNGNREDGSHFSFSGEMKHLMTHYDLDGAIFSPSKLKLCCAFDVSDP